MSIPESGTRISLRVYPNAGRDEVLGFTDGVLQVKIAAPPIKGKANERLVAFLSRLLGVGKGSISIIRGHTSRNKLIKISDLSRKDIIERLSFSSGDDARE